MPKHPENRYTFLVQTIEKAPLLYTKNISLVYFFFPKGEFLGTHRCESPWFEWLSSPWFIVSNFPYIPWSSFGGWVVVVGGDGWVGVFLGQILTFFKVVWKLFWNCMGIVFGLKRPILASSIDPKKFLRTTKIEIFGWNLRHFFKIGIRDLTNFGAKKYVFLTFWKLVWSCSEVV